MQATKPATKTSRLSTAAVIFFIIICGCIFISIGNDADDETEDPAITATTTTATITSTATIPPTETPQSSASGASPTPNPANDPYFFESAGYVFEYQQVFQSVQEQTQLAADYPSLMLDQSWKTEMAFRLVDLQAASTKLGSIEDVPDQFVPLDRIFKQIDLQTQLLVVNYTAAIDNLDAVSMERAVGNIQTIGNLFKQATGELEKFKQP